MLWTTVFSGVGINILKRRALIIELSEDTGEQQNRTLTQVEEETSVTFDVKKQNKKKLNNTHKIKKIIDWKECFSIELIQCREK